MRLSSFVLPAAGAALFVLACSDNPEPNDPSGYNQGYYGAQPQPGYPQPGYPQPYGQPQPQPTAPAPAPTGQAGTSATPIAPAAAAAAQPILTGLAQKEVAGMQPDGAAFAGQFQEGQTLEQPFNIQPGRCYSVVGVGIGIQELDIQIAAQPVPNLPPTVLAQDQTTGANATLGGKGNCFKNPLPIGGPAKVIVKATKGSGMAVAQIYVK